MSHGAALNIDIEAASKADPITPGQKLTLSMWICVGIGCISFVYGLVAAPPKLLWGVYFVNVVFWMGLAVGCVMTAVIFQIVRARWSPPVRRIAEANVSFLPWAYLLLMATYFGKDHLYPWGTEPMPGREAWMQPWFVYLRFAVLLAILFFVIWRYVRLSLRSDIGVLREDDSSETKKWHGWLYLHLVSNWGGKDKEVKEIQQKLSCFAPVVLILYVLIYSLFSFEMIMGMDKIWYSNMFGGFNFIGNLYIGWAGLSLLVMYFVSVNSDYAKTVSTQQLWDLGKLTLAFCILWTYLFLCQYLPQWYGNLPEETQWLLLRVRGTWMPLSYCVFAMLFVMPFLWLLSEDIKKTPKAYSMVCVVVLVGMWLEKYVVIMPQLSPDSIPFLSGGVLEIGLFLGFFGIYVLSITSFLKRFPFIPVSHPMTKGSIDW